MQHRLTKIKNLNGHHESKSFSGSMIRSILNHSKLFIGDGFDATPIRDVPTKQAVVIIAADTRPTAILGNEVGLNALFSINLLVVRQHFTVIDRQRSMV